MSPVSIVPTRRLWISIGLALVLLGIGIGWAVYTSRNPKSDDVSSVRTNNTSTDHNPDDMSAFRANNEGIACIERFNYPGAAKAFQETLNKAPDWPVAKINLGIALMWLARKGEAQEKEASTNRAIALFQDILTTDPDNPYAHFCLGFIYYELLNDWKESRLHFNAVTLKDSTEAYAWYWLGMSWMMVDDNEAALKCFRKANSLNPYLNGALYSSHLLTRRKGKEA